MEPSGVGPAARPESTAADRLQEVWALLCGIGVGLCVLGLLSAVASFVAGLAAETVVGILLFLGAVFQATNTFWAYRWKGFGLHLVVGVLYFLAGVFLIEHPGESAGGPILLLACCFLVGGGLKIALALVERFAGWAWTLATGVGSALMGTILLCRWPVAGVWTVGVFVGVELLSSGVAWVVLGLAVRPTGALAPHSPAGTGD